MSDMVFDGAPDAPAGGLQARAVSVRFGRAVLLPPVSFDLAPSQIAVLTGPNGVGKTTLLRVLAGQQPPTSGRAVVADMTPDARRPAFRRAVAQMLASRPLSHTLTIAEHIALTALTWGFSSDDAARLGEALMERFGIASLSDRFPHQLSLGQLQAASLCVTLARPFQVLLLDEPDHALDDDRLAALEEELRAAAARGAAVVLATHNQALRLSMVDKVVDLEGLWARDGAREVE